MFPFAALTPREAAGIAVLVALAAVLAVAGLRLARRRRGRAAPAGPGPAATSAATPTQTGSGLQAPGSGMPSAIPGSASAATSTATPTEAEKREAYRQKKAAERADKEQRRREREEADRQARQEAERLAREAEQARRRAEEEERRRIQAEAGKTLAAGLAKTRSGFVARLDGLLRPGRSLDETALAELEEVLFTADIGVKTATALLDQAREKLASRELSDPARLRQALRAEIARIVSIEKASGGAPRTSAGTARPWVVMVVGVNGSGKTTTVGKLAAHYQRAGLTVLLGAGDTFRAAAGEQLEAWAERVGALIVRGKEGGDPASVCFDAVKQAVARGTDVVILDTAGRLHTKVPLMDELKKVKRVVEKALPGAPHEVVLVLDATNGQNGIAQARQFHEALGVTGIALAKLDGTAKGGVVIGISDELGIPVRWVGLGEGVGDLRPFDPDEFVQALFA